MWLNWLECAVGDWKRPGPLGQKFKCGRATYISSLGQRTNVQLPLSGVVLSKQYLIWALRALVTKKCMYVCMWLNWLECAVGDWKQPGPLGQSSSTGGPHT